MSSDCVFCKIVAGEAPATITDVFDDAIVIVPLNPVTPGHLLVIPKTHVRDFADNPRVTADVMYRAAYIGCAYPGYEHCNLITSAGEWATQTVFHLHVHLVPRREGDGLHLPWTGQRDQA